MKDYKIENIEKQRLTLTAFMKQVIEEDIWNFMSEYNPTGFLNRVFSAMIMSSEVNPAMEKERRKQEYKKSLSKMPWLKTAVGDKTDLIADEFASADIKKYIVLQDQKLAIKEDDAQSIVIRLSNENQRFLESDQVKINWGPGAPFKTRKLFLEYILEEYTQKNDAEREKIFFHDIFSSLESELKAKPSERNSMILTARIPSNKVVSTEKKIGKRSKKEARIAVTKEHLFIPYKLSKGQGGKYYYIAGVARPINRPDTPLLPKSFRISRIENIKTLNDKSGLTKDQEKEIALRIKEAGIAYVSNNNEDADKTICVILTKEGVKEYRRALNNRPMFDSSEMLEDGRTMLQFHCSIYQAENYFFQFGANAEIVSPEELKSKFKKRYKAAYELYQ